MRKGWIAGCLTLGLAACASGPEPFDYRDAATGYRMEGSGIMLNVSGPATPKDAIALASAHCQAHFWGARARLGPAELNVPNRTYHFLCGDPDW